MSDNITLPFEIQAEILKRVPDAKSLLQFRSVSKSWKFLIDSPQFIADYHHQPQPRHHVFVFYINNHRRNRYVSIIDNDDDDNHSFAQHKLPLSIPNSVESLRRFEVYGSSKGLFCFYRNHSSKYGIAVLWNPSIRKSVTIDMPKVKYISTMGFGVSPYSNDPKLVRIQSAVNVSDLKPRRVEIYSLSTGEWRNLSENLPRSSVVFNNCHVAIGNFIFWLAHEMKGMGMEREMIIIFDMISEKFMETYLPDHVVLNDPDHELSLFNLQESLVLVAESFNLSVEKWFFHVWMMESSVSDSFTYMYSIIRPDEDVYSLLAFRNNGHSIIQMDDDKFIGSDELVVYDFDSEEFIPIGPSESIYTIYASSYMETLLLLDH